MVVEQRIGRIDRIGQEAKKMIIVNLVAEGTIEERILLRLYERIGLFRETIGEMDEIIGPRELQKLMAEALCGELTDDQLQKQVESTAKAAEEKIAEAKKLSQESDILLAADQSFLDEINTLISSRRIPDTADLRQLLLDLLENKFSGIHYEEGQDDKPGALSLGRDAVMQFDDWSRKYSFDAHRTAQRFQQYGRIPVTFDAEVAMKHPRSEFIQARHPLIQFSIHLLEQSLGMQSKTFALQIAGDDLRKGLWIMGVWSITLIASRPETRLEAVACNINTGRVIAGASADELLVSCLAGVSDMDIEVIRPDTRSIAKCIPLLKETYNRRRAEIITEARDIEERKLARARSTWLQTLTIRKNAAQQRVQNLKQNQAQEFAIRMAEASLDKRMKALQAKQDEFSETAKLRWEEHEIAAMVLSII